MALNGRGPVEGAWPPLSLPRPGGNGHHPGPPAARARGPAAPGTTHRSLEGLQVNDPVIPASEPVPPAAQPPDPGGGEPEELEPAASDAELRGPVQTWEPETGQEPAPVEVVLVEAPPDPQAAHDSPPSIAAAAVAMDGGAAAVATDGGAAAAAVTAGEAFAAKAAQAEATAEKLIADLSARLTPGMSEDVQSEAAALIALISDLAYEEFTEFFPLARVAANALTADPPNLTLATRLRRDIRMRTHLLLRPLLFLRTGHPAVQVILGLSTNLYLAIPLALFLLPQAVRGSIFPGQNDQHFILVGLAGAVGSIVSMLVRIQDFDDEKAEHRAILFFTGFFKPVIGVASALFMVIILEAGLIPLGIADTDRRVFFFLALAFVAGFSERLASDLVSQAEGTVLKGGKGNQGPGGSG